MFYMFVDLHYNYDFVSLRYVKWFYSDILVPHTNFNKSQPTFQVVAGNTVLTLSNEYW